VLENVVAKLFYYSCFDKVSTKLVLCSVCPSVSVRVRVRIRIIVWVKVRVGVRVRFRVMES
jgi:hypothetical protein